MWSHNLKPQIVYYRHYYHQLVLIRTEECSSDDGDENKAATVCSIRSWALPAAAFSTGCDSDISVDDGKRRRPSLPNRHWRWSSCFSLEAKRAQPRHAAPRFHMAARFRSLKQQISFFSALAKTRPRCRAAALVKLAATLPRSGKQAWLLRSDVLRRLSSASLLLNTAPPSRLISQTHKPSLCARSEFQGTTQAAHSDVFL